MNKPIKHILIETFSISLSLFLLNKFPFNIQIMKFLPISTLVSVLLFTSNSLEQELDEEVYQNCHNRFQPHPAMCNKFNFISSEEVFLCLYLTLRILKKINNLGCKKRLYCS